MTQALPGGSSSGDIQTGTGGSNGNTPGTTTPQKPPPNAQPMTQDQIDAQNAAAAAAAQRQDYLNHFNYGGVAGGAQAAAGMFNGLAGAAQSRQGQQINYSGANNAYAQSQQAGGQEQLLAQIMAGRANGSVPLIAQQQADRQMGQATAAQMSAAASARGPAGLALAQQQAAGNIAGAQSNISNQAQINGAQEQIANANAAFGAYSGMRGQDLQGTAQQSQMAQAQAQLDAAQRAQNDQYSTSLYGLGNQVNIAQLGAQGNQIGIESGATTAANNLALASKENDQNQGWKIGGAVLGGLGVGFGTLGSLGLFGGKTDPNSGATRTVGGIPGGGSGNSDFGAPGSTPGGTDQNGLPVAGSGGGFDPDSDPSDVTAKRNIVPLGYGLSAMPTRERAEIREFDQMKRQMEAQRYGLMSQGPSVRNRDDAEKLQAMAAMDRNPTTMQFAQGLAPSTYEYRDGIPGASPGMKMGPMAQNMAANPLTGTAVRQMPNGLLGIDNKDGLKVALGGVGHLAQRQQMTDAQVARLMAESDAMKRQAQGQYQGLMAQGSAVGAYQAPPQSPGVDPRAAEADRMLTDINAQGQGLMAQGPSVGQQYLNYTRGQ